MRPHSFDATDSTVVVTCRVAQTTLQRFLLFGGEFHLWRKKTPTINHARPPRPGAKRLQGRLMNQSDAEASLLNSAVFWTLRAPWWDVRARRMRKGRANLVARRLY